MSSGTALGLCLPKTPLYYSANQCSHVWKSVTCLGRRATDFLESSSPFSRAQNAGSISAMLTYFHYEILSTTALGSGANPSSTYTATYTAPGSLRWMSAWVHGSIPAVLQDTTGETINDMVRTAPYKYDPDEPTEVESLPPPTGLSPDVTVNNNANDPTGGHDPSEPGWTGYGNHDYPILYFYQTDLTLQLSLTPQTLYIPTNYILTNNPYLPPCWFHIRP